MNKLSYVLEYKKYIAVGFLIVILQTMVAFFIPILIRAIIDTAQVGQLKDIQNDVIYVFLVITVLFLLKVLRIYFFAMFSLHFKTREAKRLFNLLFQAKLSSISKNGPTYYTERIYSGLHNMFSLVSDISIKITTVAITLVVSLILVLGVSPIFFLLFFMLLPLTYISYKKLNKTLQTKSEILQQKCAMNFGYIINLLQNFTEIKKLFNYQLFSSTCKKYVSKIVEENNKVTIFGQTSSGLIQFITDVIKQGILIFAIYLLMIGEIGFAEVVFVEMILVIYTNGLSELTSININLRDVNAFQKFVNTEILNQAEVDNGTIELTDINEISINIKDFSYSNEKKILADIHLTINKGECIGIVGDSGSGKSTLLNLLIRLYDANGIFIDRIPVHEFTIKSLRRNIYIVSQTPYIFPGTIEDNLCIGLQEDKKERRMDTLLESQFLRDFIKEFPQGLSTQIQEGASNLSGGQKQKIMVARALLYDPQLMILDESTAEMDGASESTILEYLLRKKEDMINIIVSHRLSTIKMCDKLMVLKNGRIIDFGTLEELKKSSEEFKRIFESQLS